MKKVLILLAALLVGILTIAAAALLILTVAEYRPADTETVLADHPAEAVLAPDQPLTVLSWNCGYGALGDNADFFMDGGKSVYSSEESRVSSNLEGIRSALKDLDPDLILLQEVDARSDRSYRKDQREALKSAFPGWDDAFAYNFNSLFVPYPLPPIGHVESGLYTLSRVPLRQAERISLPCPFSWPIRIVNLKRCLLVSRIPVSGTDRELVLINLHLEAYDSGEGKEAQTRQLIFLLQQEAGKGNYVIAGGDFNQQFSNVDCRAYPVFEGMWQPGFIRAEDFGEELTLLMDSSVPTCRSLDRPLAGADPASFQFYMIDGFIVSANVQVEKTETLDYGFACTDHNPVLLRCVLAP